MPCTLASPRPLPSPPPSPSLLLSSRGSQTLWGFKNDWEEEQRTVWQADGGPASRGSGAAEGRPGLCTRDSEAFLAPPPAVRREKNVKERKDRAEIQQPNNQSLYVRWSTPSTLPLLSPSHSLPHFFSLIGAHSLVFHHTYPHLNFTNPIYCYLYPWLLLSLLLLLLLLWLELLSSRAIFSFYFHGFKYWFWELGGCLGN